MTRWNHDAWASALGVQCSTVGLRYAGLRGGVGKLDPWHRSFVATACVITPEDITAHIHSPPSRSPDALLLSLSRLSHAITWNRSFWNQEQAACAFQSSLPHPLSAVWPHWGLQPSLLFCHNSRSSLSASGPVANHFSFRLPALLRFVPSVLSRTSSDSS